MKLSVTAVLLLFSFSLSAQYRQLSTEAEISIITIGPGPEFNDCFGHSAFRVRDPRHNIDLAYNYGTFNTEEPGFYTRFALGVQDYYLAAYNFEPFLESYKLQNRWIKEQVLNLSPNEVQHVFEQMEEDRKPENRGYRYGPYFNNCATKMRDLTVDALGDKISFDSSHLTKKRSIRGLTHIYGYNHPWWDLGVDLALGTRIDREASPSEHMFLPDYVFKAYENATISRDGREVPAVRSKAVLFESDYHETRHRLVRPWMVFSLAALLVTLLTYLDFVKNRRSRWLDFSLMFLTGLLGVVMIFLWFFTGHATTPNNLNVLWAFAPNLYVGFVMLKKNPPAWVRSYVRFLVILLLAALFVWLLAIQVYASSLISVMIFLAVRYVFLWRKGLVEATD
ncbi:MAG: DUF4105 domain-containing protein [Roseivirga sp.]|nr:DUF4105 domain-containing protein [Roseivirga sp.]